MASRSAEIHIIALRIHEALPMNGAHSDSESWLFLRVSFSKVHSRSSSAWAQKRYIQREWRIGRGQRRISSMVSKREAIIALALSLLLSCLTLIPYLLAYQLAEPESIFSGFLINPVDGFSYLAKMRQGADGNWLFRLAYTADPGEGALLFIYYLFLGRLTKWVQIQPIQMYHLSRLIFSAAMFIVAYLFLGKLLKEKRSRWAAFAFVCVGSGLGWLGTPFGILASDLWIPESIPFLSAYANAHFALATALALALVILHLEKMKSLRLQLGLAFFLGFILASIQPLTLLALGAVLFAWGAWEALLCWRSSGGSLSGAVEKWRGMVFTAMVGGAMPWLAYDTWIIHRHPQIAIWNAQNQTPSPPLPEFLLGFGLIFVLGVVSIVWGRKKHDALGRLLITWFLLGFSLLYLPFGLQRRLSMALYFPMVVLAIKAMEMLAPRKKQFWLLFAVTFFLSLPSNWVVVGSGLLAVDQQDPLVLLEASEFEAYHWLSQNAQPGELILAGPRAGNRIPAFAALRVFYGHPFETPHAQEQEELIRRLYGSPIPKDAALAELRTLGVDYVFYGPQEREIGVPSWISALEMAFHSNAYEIYRVTGQ